MSSTQRSSKKKAGGRGEKQYYILSRGLCLTKITRNKGTGGIIPKSVNSAEGSALPKPPATKKQGPRSEVCGSGLVPTGVLIHSHHWL